MLQEDVADQWQTQQRAVYRFGAAIAGLPTPHQHYDDHEHNCRYRSVSLRMVPDLEHQQRNRRQLGIQILIKLGELWHDVRHQKHEHAQHNRYKQRRIHERYNQLFLERQRKTLKSNVAVEHFIHVPRLLTRH